MLVERDQRVKGAHKKKERGSLSAAARFRKDPTTWTEQRGKEGAVSGRTIVLRD